jgi:hypothetical protein
MVNTTDEAEVAASYPLSNHSLEVFMQTQALSLAQQIEVALVEARAVSAQFGPISTEAAIAWDIVEELEAEAAHQRVKNAGKTAFSHYCDEFPEAIEARMYEV